MLVKHYRVTGVRDLQVKVKAGIIPVGKGGITHHIAVGLTYYNDLQQRMPWAEADAIARRLTELIREFDPKLTVIVCGSYRRQRPTCGDIDVLISRPDSTEQTIDSLGLLPKVVQQLTDQQLIVANLTSLGTTKFMGICQLAAGQLGRRIDIRCVPWVCLGAATLYFTGSGHFNVIMRYRANQRGYTLNEYGLYEYLQGQKGALIPAVTEEDIFQILRFVYLRPEEREF
jgi:DNA polymerase lambda